MIARKSGGKQNVHPEPKEEGTSNFAYLLGKVRLSFMPKILQRCLLNRKESENKYLD